MKILTKLHLLILGLAVVLFPAGIVGAQDICDTIPDSAFCENQVDDDTNPIVGAGGLLPKIFNFLSFAVGIVSVIMLIVGGIKIVFSGGNSESVASGRSAVVYALIGIAVVALAQTIVVFVLNRL